MHETKTSSGHKNGSGAQQAQGTAAATAAQLQAALVVRQPLAMAHARVLLGHGDRIVAADSSELLDLGPAEATRDGGGDERLEPDGCLHEVEARDLGRTCELAGHVAEHGDVLVDPGLQLRQVGYAARVAATVGWANILRQT